MSAVPITCSGAGTECRPAAAGRFQLPLRLRAPPAARSVRGACEVAQRQRTARKARRVLVSAGPQSPSEKAASAVEQSPVAIELRSRLNQTKLEQQRAGKYDWLEVEGAFCRLPAGIPEGVVHFVGGAVLGTYPQIAYDEVLKRLCDYGSLVIIATPYDLDVNHQQIAERCSTLYSKALAGLQAGYTGPLGELPVYGMGHSLGAKIQALLSCDKAVQQGREGNLMVSFNNFSPSDSVDLLEAIAAASLGGGNPDMLRSSELQMIFQGLRMASNIGGLQFIPSPEETAETIRAGYDIPRTRIFRFSEDKIDQSASLEGFVSAPRNGGSVSVADLQGNHLSPIFVSLQAGEYAAQLKGLGLDSEIRIGDKESMEALAMDIVSFTKGFTA